MDQTIEEVKLVFEKPCPYCNMSARPQPGDAPVNFRFSVKPDDDPCKIPAQPLNPAWEPWLKEVFRLEAELQGNEDGHITVSSSDPTQQEIIEKSQIEAIKGAKYLAPSEGTPKYIDCPYCKDGVMPLEEGDKNLYPKWVQRWARRILDSEGNMGPV